MFNWFKFNNSNVNIYRSIIHYCSSFKICVNNYNKENIDKLKNDYKIMLSLVLEDYKNLYDYCSTIYDFKTKPIYDIFKELEDNLNNNGLKNQIFDKGSNFEFTEKSENYIFGDLHGDFSVLVNNLNLTKKDSKPKNLFLLGDIFDPFNNEFIKANTNNSTENKILFAANNEILLFYFLMMLVNIFNYNIIWILGNHDLNYGFVYFFSFYFFFYGFQKDTKLNIVSNCTVKINNDVYYLTHESQGKAINNNLIFYQLNQLFEKSIYYRYFKILFTHHDKFKTIKENDKSQITNLLEQNKILFNGEYIDELILDLSEGLIEFKNKTQLNHEINIKLMETIINNKDKPKYSKNNRTYILNEKFVHKSKSAKHFYGHENDSKSFMEFLKISKTYNPELFKIQRLDLNVNEVIDNNDLKLSLDTTTSYFKNSGVRNEDIKKILKNKIDLSEKNNKVLDKNQQSGYLWFIYNNRHVYLNISIYHSILNSLVYGYIKQLNNKSQTGGIAQIKDKQKNEILKLEDNFKLSKSIIVKSFKMENIYNINKMNNTILPEDYKKLDNWDFRRNIIKILKKSDKKLIKKIADYQEVKGEIACPIYNILESLTDYPRKFRFFHYSLPKETKINDEIKKIKEIDLFERNKEIFNKPEIIKLIDILTPKINFLIEFVETFKCSILFNIAASYAADYFNWELSKYKQLETKTEKDKHQLTLYHCVLLYYVFMPYHKLNINEDNGWLFDILFLLNFYFCIFINCDNQKMNYNNLKPELNNKLAVLYCLIHNYLLTNFYKIDDAIFCDSLEQVANEDTMHFYYPNKGVKKDFEYYFGDRRVYFGTQDDEEDLLINYKKIETDSFYTIKEIKNIDYVDTKFRISGYGEYYVKDKY